MGSFLDKAGLEYLWNKIKQWIPTKTSDIENDSGYITGYTETDPTVPAWAKQPTKPAYSAGEVGAAEADHTHTAAEVGALPDTTVIPSKTSELTNDSNYVSDANYVHTDSNYTAAEKTKLAGIAEGANKYTHPSYTAATAAAVKVGRDATGHVVTGAALTASDIGAAASSHTHPVNQIVTGNSATTASVDPVTGAYIGMHASNKSFNLPAAAIKVEYSTDGGSTWTDYGATDAQKRALFSELRSFDFSLGKVTDKAQNSTNLRLRVTIEPTDRYVRFYGIYVWFSTKGNTTVMDLERSTIGAKDTFTSVFTGQALAGWFGANIRYFSAGAFGGGTSQTSNNYKYRITFRQTAINANYAGSIVNDIRFLGDAVWTSPNNMVMRNHLYNWDVDLNATFPAQVTATKFNGTSTAADALAHKSLTSSTLDSTAGTFAFSGSGAPWEGTDWVGVQVGDSVDKFQISRTENSLIWRYNDSGGTNTSAWSGWRADREYIKGTQTAATNAWTGKTTQSALYDGMTIDYFLPYAGTSTAATLNLTLSTGTATGAKPVYIGNGTGGVTTHFPQYSVIRMTYVVHSSLNSGNGCWKASAYYNTTYSVMSASEMKTGTATTARTMSAANIKAGIRDLFYPVGTYYETSLTEEIPSGGSTPNATDLANLGVTWFDPNYAWGGTWEKLEDHRVLISAHGTGTYALGSTGGSVSNSINLNNLPPGMVRSAGTKTSRQIKALTGGTDYYTVTSASAWTVSNTSTQNGFSVMQPWVAVNRWHRTA